MLTLVIAGCTGDTVTDEPILAEVEALAPVAISIGSGAGVGTVMMPVRLVNEYGAAVPGIQVTLSVSGASASLAQSAVQFDADGYALAQVDAPHPQVFSLSATSAADTTDLGEPANGYFLPDRAPDMLLSPAAFLAPGTLETATAAVAGTGGMAVAVGAEVWWVPSASAMPPHQVANLAFDVAGMAAAHIDSDGILDMALWGGSDVVMLRGHEGGGYSWGGAWRVADKNVSSVVLADMNDDRITDLTVGVAGANVGGVQVLAGDGVWGFEPLAPLLLDYPVQSVTGADEYQDGRPDVTVMSATTGYVDRHTLTGDVWAGGSPPELIQLSAPYSAPVGSKLLPMADLNMDGKLDVVVSEGFDDGAQNLNFFTLGNLQTIYSQSYGLNFVDLADLDGNGSTDMLALEDGVLHTIRFDDAKQVFTSQKFITVGDAGPIASIDLTNDGVVDVGAATDFVSYYDGTIVEETGLWSLDSHAWRQYSTNFSGAWLVRDVEGDGTVDIVGFKEDSGGDTLLTIWDIFVNDDDAVQISTSGTENVGAVSGYGVTECGGYWFALYGDATNSTLALFDIERNGSFYSPAISKTANTSGTLLACGTAQNGNPGVVVASATGSYTIYSRSLAAITTGSVGATNGIALADTDGDGIGEAYGCGETGCTVVGADLDDDGTDEVVTGGSAIAVTGWGGTTTLPGSGAVSLTDTTEWGTRDVLAVDVDRGTMALYRGVAGGLTWPSVWTTTRVLEPPLAMGDVDGDGLPEMIAGGESGAFAHSEQHE